MLGKKEIRKQSRQVTSDDGQGAGGSSSRDIIKVLARHITHMHIRSYWLEDDSPVDKNFIETMSADYDEIVNWLKANENKE